MTVFSGLRGAALFIVVIVTVGVIGYHVLGGYTWLEALYMTVITLSTVGFHEVQPLDPKGQIFTIVLIVGGLGAVFYTVVTVAEKVVEGEFQQFFGRRRMQKQIEALTDHYLVCGFGRIGQVICRELASKPVPFVVIEQHEERVQAAEAAQYLVLPGDATDEEILRAAGVTLSDSGLCGQPGIIVVAIKRASGKMFFNPAPGEKIEAGDSLIALAETPQLREIERRVRGEI